MKKCFITILACVWWSSAFSQKGEINFSFKDLPLEIILDSLSVKYGYDFSYNADIIPPGNLYTYTAKDISIQKLLDVLLVGTGLDYVKVGDQLVLRQIQKASEQVIKPDKISIQGWVRDSKSKEPIVGANVYVNGSTIGTVTDEYGNYQLRNLEPGDYMLVFSHVGFLPSVYQIEGNEVRKFTINSLLNQEIIELENVEVVSERLYSKNELNRLHRIFQSELLGTSSNASNCEIENPEVIDFQYNGNWDFLDVSASEPIIISNYGLGYRIHFDLHYFVKDQDELNYHGTARFEKLTPESNKQRKKWRRNRQKAYNGSLNHFFDALNRDQLSSEGFNISYIVEDIYDWDYNNRKAINTSDILKKDKGTKQLKLVSDHPILVEYVKELQSMSYLEYLQSHADNPNNINGAIFRHSYQAAHSQKSILQLKDKEIKLNKQGKPKDRLQIVTYGYWSWERLADLLPIDYNPKSDFFHLNE